MEMIWDISGQALQSGKRDVKCNAQERLRVCQGMNHDSTTPLIFPEKTVEKQKETIDRACDLTEQWALED